MELNLIAYSTSIVVAIQIITNNSPIGRRDKKVFVLRMSRFSSDRPNGSVAARDVENPGVRREFCKLFSPEFMNYAVIIIGFAGAERSNETLPPKSRPLFEVFILSSDNESACSYSGTTELYSQFPKTYENVRRAAYLVVNWS